MSSNAKHLPALNMRVRSSSRSLRPGNSIAHAIKPHRQAISPSAAGELAGMFTTHSPSPIGLSVLFGSQRITALRQSATHHGQVGRASFGAQRIRTVCHGLVSIRHNLWKSVSGRVAVHQTNINIHGQFGVFLSALASVTCLTRQSRGHQRAAHIGAPYFGR